MDNAELLITKYPLLFSVDPRISYPDGWHPLLDSLCEKLMQEYESEKTYLKFAIDHRKDADLAHQFDDAEMLKRETMLENAKNSLCKIHCIKEKFGTLRVYYVGGTQKHSDTIEFCEHLSGTVCEECGATNNVTTYPIQWFRTLCGVHAVEHYGDRAVEYINTSTLVNIK